MSICGQYVCCASALSWPPARPHPGISQSKQSDPQSSLIRYDVISTFLCLILCCWHWGGCKLCVKMSSHCMNTWFGASHRNYGDRRQILMCVALWVGVLGGSIFRDSPTFMVTLSLFHQKTLYCFGRNDILKLMMAVYSIVNITTLVTSVWTL